MSGLGLDFSSGAEWQRLSHNIGKWSLAMGAPQTSYGQCCAGTHRSQQCVYGCPIYYPHSSVLREELGESVKLKQRSYPAALTLKWLPPASPSDPPAGKQPWHPLAPRPVRVFTGSLARGHEQHLPWERAPLLWPEAHCLESWVPLEQGAQLHSSHLTKWRTHINTPLFARWLPTQELKSGNGRERTYPAYSFHREENTVWGGVPAVSPHIWL